MAFYTNICNFKLVGDTIYDLKRDSSPNTAIFEMYPPGLKHVKVAMMTTGSGPEDSAVGFEIMEFISPPCHDADPNAFEYHRPGWFHICLTVEDPDELVERIVEAGGRRIGKTADPIGNGVKCLYAADPWGNALEIMSVSFTEITELAAQAPPA